MKSLPRLYAIADAAFGDPVRIAATLFDAGARLVQVRNKKGAARELLEEVDRILSFAPPDADVIVNDRADVALIAGAAGVHLGQTDLQPINARRVLGDGKIIGLSTHNLGQALQAEGYPLNYVAVGPIFTTASKENPDPVIGLDGLAGICRAIRKPVVAIGGIKLANAREVLEAGATSVAVISDVLSAPDVGLRVRKWLDALR